MGVQKLTSYVNDHYIPKHGHATTLDRLVPDKPIVVDLDSLAFALWNAKPFSTRYHDLSKEQRLNNIFRQDLQWIWQELRTFRQALAGPNHRPVVFVSKS
jgi:hypothetical protein